jgi:hypothetical protein
MTNDSDTLWFNTTGYGQTAPKLAYLTDEQNRRRERLRVTGMLWKGRHRQAFLTESRSQFDFPELEIQGRIWWPYITLNILRLISTTMTDLAVGEDPAITLDDPDGQEEIDALRERSHIDRVFYDAIKGASWGGECFAEVLRWRNQSYIQDVCAAEVYPIGQRQPDGQYVRYTRYATAMSAEPPPASPRKLLLESTYEPGRITRACWFLNGDSVKTGNADLSLWPVKRPDGTDLPPEEATGIDSNTLIWMGNEIDEGCPISDYDGLIELQDELNAKQTQIARVIAQHADPAVAFPARAADPDGNIRTRKKAFFFDSREDIPQYIVWNAELAAAIEDRDFTLNALCIAAELSQGLLGLEKGGAPDSARKLRLQATKSLARVKRKAKQIRPFIRQAVNTSLEMTRAARVVKVAMGLNGVDGGGVAVDLRDGLPIDDLDQATVISTLTGGKPTMSVERGVALQINDPKAAAKELETLKKETAEAAPSVNIQGPVGEMPASLGMQNAEFGSQKSEDGNDAMLNAERGTMNDGGNGQ